MITETSATSLVLKAIRLSSGSGGGTRGPWSPPALWKYVIKKMAAEGVRIDFMFLVPPPLTRPLDPLLHRVLFHRATFTNGSWLTMQRKNIMCPLRYRTAMSTGNYIANDTIPSGWFHTVLNFIGPDDGIRIYHDGVEVGSDTNIHGNPKHNGERRIVIGRYFVKSATSYS